MDPALKSKWVEALRSGEYEQGKHNFELGGKFCCLGVLCKVAGKPTRLPVKGENWDFVHNIIQDHGLMETLYEMNDGGYFIAPEQKSFREIADYIEANL